MKPMQKAEMRFLKVVAEYRMTDRKHVSIETAGELHVSEN
jgi:hypothetical protein